MLLMLPMLPMPKNGREANLPVCGFAPVDGRTKKKMDNCTV